MEVEFPEIKQIDITQIPSDIGEVSDTYSTVLVDVEVIENGDKDQLGKLMLILDRESALKFADHLEKEVCANYRENSGQLNEIDESALKETGNILTGACLAAMTGWVDLQLKEGIPSIETDMLGATLDQILIDISRDVDEVLLFKTEFNFEENIDANFLFLFEPEGEKEVLEKIKV